MGKLGFKYAANSVNELVLFHLEFGEVSNRQSSLRHPNGSALAAVNAR
jgi:hypothetical protein